MLQQNGQEDNIIATLKCQSFKIANKKDTIITSLNNQILEMANN